MRPIFTIHAGEYLVATKIEKDFPEFRVWIPSKDTGIDLLVTDANCNKIASLQVKFSKDYLGNSVRSTIASGIESGGWWNFNRQKLADSPADYWVLVLYQFHSRKFDFVIISPKELLERYDELTSKSEIIKSYLWVTKSKSCWETRGLVTSEHDEICSGKYSSSIRDFSKYLNDWSFLK